MQDAGGRVVGLCITAFLAYAVLVLGWSAGQMLVGIWLQTLVLWVLVALAALVVAARSHWAVFLAAVPLVGFVFFVTGQFINLFGAFAWGAWGSELGSTVRLPSFNPFRNAIHFVRRAPEVLPVWQIGALIGLEVFRAAAALSAPRARAGAGWQRLFEGFHRKLFVNHLAVLLGAVLAAVGGSRAILLALLALLFAIDLIGLVRALRSPPASAA
jgi:hypothetical protein